MVRVPGFEPGLQAWQARVIPGYTTPACFGPELRVNKALIRFQNVLYFLFL